MILDNPLSALEGMTVGDHQAKTHTHPRGVFALFTFISTSQDCCDVTAAFWMQISFPVKLRTRCLLINTGK